MIEGKLYHILIVDDQQDNVFLLEMLLKRQSNFVIHSVDNGLKAVEFCGEHDVDLVLMDVMMPVMDGNMATKKIREMYDVSELPVIMVTTLSDIDNLIKSFDAGASDYVTKPIEWNALKVRMASNLRVRDSHLEKQRLMTETQVLNQRLKQFSFAIAHDIRNPLSHIQILCDALAEELMGKEEVASQIRELASKVCSFMDNILEHSAYAKIESAEEVDLNQLMMDVFQFLGSVIEERSAEIVRDELSTVRGNKGLLFQLFLNLVGNALKYVPKGRQPKIEVKCSTSDEWVEISVVDNGMGMSEEDLAVVKQPLMRGRSSEGTEGSGLGLSLAKIAMDEMKGSLSIESTEGDGATVKLKFPRLQTS